MLVPCASKEEKGGPSFLSTHTHTHNLLYCLSGSFLFRRQRKKKKTLLEGGKDRRRGHFLRLLFFFGSSSLARAFSLLLCTCLISLLLLLLYLEAFSFAREKGTFFFQFDCKRWRKKKQYLIIRPCSTISLQKERGNKWNSCWLRKKKRTETKERENV